MMLHKPQSVLDDMWAATDTGHRQHTSLEPNNDAFASLMLGFGDSKKVQGELVCTCGTQCCICHNI